MQPQQQRSKSAILLLLAATVAALVATVASVPTSVLVQNSELASNAAAGGANKNHINDDNNNNGHSSNNNNNRDNVIMTKVKRSSNNAKDSSSSSSSPTSANYAGLDKKSSPEIVPASFNAPPVKIAAAPQAAATISLPTNGEIINSAIAAGLTAAAVEAAAAASQREFDQQQQQFSQLYGGGDAETPTLLHKRGISSPQLQQQQQQPQYLYGGNGAGLGGGYGGLGGGYGGLGGGYGGYGSNADFYNNPYYPSYPLSTSQSSSGAGLTAIPNGMWTDEMDPAIVYTDLQDLDDYVPAQRAPSSAAAASSASYRNKAYDNLQSLLNSEAYLEPVVLPQQQQQQQYLGRYYGAVDADRNKRTNLNKFNKYADMRLKRDTKLTPADMLALVALVEAGERARTETDNDAAYMYAPPSPVADRGSKSIGGSNKVKSYYPSYPSIVNENGYDYPAAVDAVDADYNGAWMEPAMVDYYGLPVNMDSLPKYELTREHKYGGGNGNGNANNRYPAKRFMVAKKKRSLGKFLNEPVGKPSISFTNGEKYF